MKKFKGQNPMVLYHLALAHDKTARKNSPAFFLAANMQRNELEGMVSRPFATACAHHAQKCLLFAQIFADAVARAMYLRSPKKCVLDP
jgi:hypothetical protein